MINDSPPPPPLLLFFIFFSLLDIECDWIVEANRGCGMQKRALLGVHWGKGAIKKEQIFYSRVFNFFFSEKFDMKKKV